ncbi:aminoacyl-histidine dipeptidase [bacterium BRH_c32]|nr:MAG: aminoacyl-histidine dipeptidase [bacterium BRH_c32]
MSKAIEGLNPQLLWERFEEISNIPRPSKHEEKVVEYLRKFAKENNLVIREDSVSNIIMELPATKGFENKPTIVLQGHIDMVCEKNKGTEHDFMKDSIKLIREDGWIRADGTTLGADNGIGVAAALAIANDTSFEHGPIELLFTVDEETGLTGANNLEVGFVKGKILLNLDSEEDGAFYVGCSGGQDTVGTFKCEYSDAPKGFDEYEILIGGLKGGHSGLNISDGRANAIKILARLLNKFNDVQFAISSINGGSKRNAIAREAELKLFIESVNLEKIKKYIEEFKYEYKSEFTPKDPEISISIKQVEEKSEKVFSESFTQKILNVILAMPHGVIAMSQDIPDLVETSTNLATVVYENDEIKIGTSQRSSIESAKKYVASSVKAVFDLACGEVKVGDGYPGWKPNMKSEALMKAKTVYQDLYKNVPEIKAIHAGLECGILGGKYPGLDMLSFGPTIEGAHSPDERVNIKDVEKFYDLLKAILVEFTKN